MKKMARTTAATLLFIALLFHSRPALAVRIPSLADETYLRDVSVIDVEFPQMRGASSLPSSFDLEPLGALPPVKNQLRFGTCWSFAALSAMESNMLMRTGVRDDLSEIHLAYFSIVDESPDKPAFTTVIPPGSTNANPIFDNGGNTDCVKALLSRGTGPVYEADTPYPSFDIGDVEAWVSYVPDPPPNAPARFRLKESLSFMQPDDIKAAMMAHGGLVLSFNSSSVLDTTNPYIFDPHTTTTDHDVILVGWDDDLPRELFRNKNGEVPKNDGGWRIQNSWGTENNGKPRGDRGYYWISYEDASVQSCPTSTFVAIPLESWDGIYSHDPLGYVYYLKQDTVKLSAANIYVASRDEELVAVGLEVKNTNIPYEVRIVLGIPENGDPSEGRNALATPISGRTGATGYRTIDLDTPVRLRKGERFAVVLTLTADRLSYPSDQIFHPVEIKYAGVSDKVTAERGEGYLDLHDGKGWVDLLDHAASRGDIQPPSEPVASNCIKAFTLPLRSSSSGVGCEVGAPFILLFALVLEAARRRRRVK